ncbi:hypothetical protein AAFF_G00077620 [Aldrovandia affinis]|uniref:Uncharacterized protein n=1 Tax=Aldrovandia affinis TaxID=143900 RepID=A0AAD7RXN3_9TELE|nr:hypothetical protein AAFF_G00077620 [Aldrovandia affinis]
MSEEDVSVVRRCDPTLTHGKIWGKAGLPRWRQSMWEVAEPCAVNSSFSQRSDRRVVFSRCIGVARSDCWLRLAVWQHVQEGNFSAEFSCLSPKLAERSATTLAKLVSLKQSASKASFLACRLLSMLAITTAVGADDFSHLPKRKTTRETALLWFWVWGWLSPDPPWRRDGPPRPGAVVQQDRSPFLYPRHRPAGHETRQSHQRAEGKEINVKAQPQGSYTISEEGFPQCSTAHPADVGTDAMTERRASFDGAPPFR